MVAYQVFFTAKREAEEAQIVASLHEFLGALRSDEWILGYRLLRVTDAASFAGLPQFQAIIDFESREKLDAAMAHMRDPSRLEVGPHGVLMEGVGEFRVCFSADA